MEQILNEAWQIRRENFPNVIQLDFPAKTKSISVTGSECLLKCAHCNGHFLQAMAPISTWQESLDKDIKSCLISGGCDKEGRVPISHYLSHIRGIKNSRRQINLHVGLQDEKEIEQLSQVADVISFDFVGDNETIREVYGLNKRVEDYILAYLRLKRKVTVIPHICIGLRGGRISGEYKALEVLKELGVKGLVFIVFSPTEGTLYADREPAPIEEVIRILCKARVDFPDIPINLGCMRPKGRYRLELDQLALRSGVNKIVQPTPGVMALAKKMGLEVIRGEECCVL